MCVCVCVCVCARACVCVCNSNVFKFRTEGLEINTIHLSATEPCTPNNQNRSVL